MKKTLTAMISLFVLLGAVMLTGCSKEIREGLLEETYDTWYQVKKGSTSTFNIPIADKDPDNASNDGVMKNAQIYVRYNPDSGLELTFATTQSQSINYLGGLYQVKTDVTTGGTKTFSAEEFSVEKWGLLFFSGKLKKANPPEITVDISKKITNGSFNPKRILAEWLLQMIE